MGAPAAPLITVSGRRAARGERRAAEASLRLGQAQRGELGAADVPRRWTERAAEGDEWGARARAWAWSFADTFAARLGLCSAPFGLPVVASDWLQTVAGPIGRPGGQELQREPLNTVRLLPGRQLGPLFAPQVAQLAACGP